MIDIKLSADVSRYRANDISDVVCIGRKGESGAVRVLCPAEDWIQEFPDGTPKVLYRTPDVRIA